MTFTDKIVALLIERATDREAEGSPAAGVYRRVAEDVRTWWHEHQTAPLTMTDAVAESGYSEQGLRRYMRRHELAHLSRATLPVRPIAVADEGPAISAPPLTITIPTGSVLVTTRRQKPVQFRSSASPMVDAMFEG
jgi:hypothetical protein